MEPMQPIVRKLVSRTAKPSPGGVPGSLQPHQDRELRVAVEAETLEGMKKRAVVTLEQPEGSSFEIICDEGSYLAGDDTAPPAAFLLQCRHRLLNAHGTVPVRDDRGGCPIHS